MPPFTRVFPPPPPSLEFLAASALAYAVEPHAPFDEQVRAATMAAAAVPARDHIVQSGSTEHLVTDLVVAAAAVTDCLPLVEVLVEAALQGSRPITRLAGGLVRVARAARERGHSEALAYVVVRMAELPSLDLAIDAGWVQEVLRDPRTWVLDPCTLDRIHARQPSPLGWLLLANLARQRPSFTPQTSDRTSLDEALARADEALAVVLARWLRAGREGAGP